MQSGKPVTELQRAWREGDEDAVDALTASVYDEFRRLAGARMRSERAGLTLDEIAAVRRCSAPRVLRRLKSAQIWLAHRLRRGDDHEDHA